MPTGFRTLAATGTSEYHWNIGYQSKLDRWPIIQNVTPSHSLLGQLYGPKRPLWRRHIPYWVNFMTQNVTKNCSKAAIRSENCSKTVKIENVTTSPSLLGQLYGPKSKMWRRHIPYRVNFMAQIVTAWRRHIPYWVNFMAQKIRCKQRASVKKWPFSRWCDVTGPSV